MQNREKLIRQLFVGKVSEILGYEKTIELLKESINAFPKNPNEEIEEQSKRDEFAVGLLNFITSEKVPYAILYGNQSKRFSDLKKEYTSKQIVEIYKATLTKK